MVEPPRPVSVVSVVALNDLHLQLDFDDGLSRTVDVTPYVQGPHYKQIRLSEKFFKTAHVESGSVVWDNGVMLDADLLRYGPPKPEKPEKVKAAKTPKPVKHIAKPKPKAKLVKAKPAKAKPPAKKVVQAIKPVKKAKPAAKPTKAKSVEPVKKAAKKKK
ncbi:MAG: DUF2442 domain-containing protein [Planctomycetaceae bacterium]|nr:DUF2442 domain-containing protein [Planctomycetaceae bacterium]